MLTTAQRNEPEREEPAHIRVYNEIKARTDDGALVRAIEQCSNATPCPITGSRAYESAMYDAFRDAENDLQNTTDAEKLGFGIFNLLRINNLSTRRFSCHIPTVHSDIAGALGSAVSYSSSEEVILFALGFIANHSHDRIFRSDGDYRLRRYVVDALSEWLKSSESTPSITCKICAMQVLAQLPANDAVEAIRLACDPENEATNPILMLEALKALERIETDRSKDRADSGSSSWKGPHWDTVPEKLFVDLGIIVDGQEYDIRKYTGGPWSRDCGAYYNNYYPAPNFLSADVIEAIGLCLLWKTDWIDKDGNEVPEEDSRSYSEIVFEAHILAIELLAQIPRDLLSEYPDQLNTLIDLPSDRDPNCLKILATARSLQGVSLSSILRICKSCFSNSDRSAEDKLNALSVLELSDLLSAENSSALAVFLKAASDEDAEVSATAKEFLSKNIYAPLLSDPQVLIKQIVSKLMSSNEVLRNCFIADLLESASTNGMLAVASALVLGEYKAWIKNAALIYLLENSTRLVEFSLLAQLAISTSEKSTKEKIAKNLVAPVDASDDKLVEICEELIKSGVLDLNNLERTFWQSLLPRSRDNQRIFTFVAEKYLSNDTTDELRNCLGEGLSIPDGFNDLNLLSRLASEATHMKVRLDSLKAYPVPDARSLASEAIEDSDKFKANLEMCQVLLKLVLQDSQAGFSNKLLVEHALYKLGAFLPWLELNPHALAEFRDKVKLTKDELRQLYELCLNATDSKASIVALNVFALLSVNTQVNAIFRLALGRLLESPVAQIRQECLRLSRILTSSQGALTHA